MSEAKQTLQHKTVWEQIYNAKSKKNAKDLAREIYRLAEDLYREAQEEKQEQIKRALGIPTEY